MENKHVIKIKKKEFPLVFSLGTLQRMEEFIDGFDLTNVDNILRSTKGLLDILYCLAEQGAIAEGRRLEEDRAWFGANAPAAQKWIIQAHTTIVETLVDGMSMETDEEDDDAEVDVVLEELKKKRRENRLTWRQAVAYGLIAGLRYDEMQNMKPGAVLDLFVYRRKYDDVLHRITREKDRIYD